MKIFLKIVFGLLIIPFEIVFFTLSSVVFLVALIIYFLTNIFLFSIGNPDGDKYIFCDFKEFVLLWVDWSCACFKELIRLSKE